ncbi:transcriptional repressor LexA [Candidatus Aerophobetes bacterium]|nr:transcriptional repressor LexA [Candidatus Aerophobetes bacterium]
MADRLTTRQKKLLEFIQDYLHEYGYPPTQEEMAKELKIEWTRAVEKHLQALEKKGYLKRGKGARCIRLATHTRGLSIPILGTISAGSPIVADENIEGFINLDERVVPKGTCFFLNVEGDSMKDAGILDKDLVLVRCQEVAEKGDIVAFLSADGVTIKYFFPEEGAIILKPANPEYEPIIIQEDSQAKILGKVVAVLRFY